MVSSTQAAAHEHGEGMDVFNRVEPINASDEFIRQAVEQALNLVVVGIVQRDCGYAARQCYVPEIAVTSAGLFQLQLRLEQKCRSRNLQFLEPRG